MAEATCTWSTKVKQNESMVVIKNGGDVEKVDDGEILRQREECSGGNGRLDEGGIDVSLETPDLGGGGGVAEGITVAESKNLQKAEAKKGGGEMKKEEKLKSKEESKVIVEKKKLDLKRKEEEKERIKKEKKLSQNKKREDAKRVKGELSQEKNKGTSNQKRKTSKDRVSMGSATSKTSKSTATSKKSVSKPTITHNLQNSTNDVMDAIEKESGELVYSNDALMTTATSLTVNDAETLEDDHISGKQGVRSADTTDEHLHRSQTTTGDSESELDHSNNEKICAGDVGERVNTDDVMSYQPSREVGEMTSQKPGLDDNHVTPQDDVTGLTSAGLSIENEAHTIPEHQDVQKTTELPQTVKTAGDGQRTGEFEERPESGLEQGESSTEACLDISESHIHALGPDEHPVGSSNDAVERSGHELNGRLEHEISCENKQANFISVKEAESRSKSNSTNKVDVTKEEENEQSGESSSGEEQEEEASRIPKSRSFKIPNDNFGNSKLHKVSDVFLATPKKTTKKVRKSRKVSDENVGDSNLSVTTEHENSSAPKDATVTSRSLTSEANPTEKLKSPKDQPLTLKDLTKKKKPPPEKPEVVKRGRTPVVRIGSANATPISARESPVSPAHISRRR